nr:uncharacterized protein LOC117278042 [Nicotiana tomentosiformis]
MFAKTKNDLSRERPLSSCSPTLKRDEANAQTFSNATWASRTRMLKPSQHLTASNAKKETRTEASEFQKQCVMNSVAFLGHIISGEGIKVDSQNVEVVKSWPRLITPTEWMHKAANFQWIYGYEKSFQDLKERLATTVLALPEGPEGYIIYCDATRVVLSSVLMQHGKLAVVIFALKIWCHCMYEVHVDVCTDHKNFQYIFKQKELNFRQRGWPKLLKDYDVDILHHSGKANIMADALSLKSTGSLQHMEKQMFEMTKNLYRLANLNVRLLDTVNGGATVRMLSNPR